MKLLIVSISLVFSSVFGAYYEELYEELKQKFDNELAGNGNPLTWKFGKNPYFMGKSKEFLRKLCGSKKPEKSKLSLKDFSITESEEKLPVNFDAREKWKNCSTISFIKDQSNCGSCWAVSSASVMSDRFCIKTGNQKLFFISEEELISCCRICGAGCDGGLTEEAFIYWATRGIPSGGPYNYPSSCKPYSIRPCPFCFDEAKTPACQHECSKEYALPLRRDRIFGERAYRLNKTDAIMQDIYHNGPVTASFTVYDDFFYYVGGIYQRGRYAQPQGGHAVRIIGWGVESDIPYWLIANSWNVTFGELGLFRIIRGVNECGIEETVVAGNPRTK